MTAVIRVLDLIAAAQNSLARTAKEQLGKVAKEIDDVKKAQDANKTPPATNPATAKNDEEEQRLREERVRWVLSVLAKLKKAGETAAKDERERGEALAYQEKLLQRARTSADPATAY